MNKITNTLFKKLRLNPESNDYIVLNDCVLKDFETTLLFNFTVVKKIELKHLKKLILSIHNFISTSNFRKFEIKMNGQVEKSDLLELAKYIFDLSILKKEKSEITFKLQNNKVYLLFENETAFSFFRKKVEEECERCLNYLGFSNDDIVKEIVNKNTNSSFSKVEVKNNENLNIFDEVGKTKGSATRYNKNVKGYTELPIDKLPLNLEALDKMPNSEVETKGEIFSIESRKFTSTTLFEIKITNYKDSIMCKSFVYDKDAQFLSTLEVGDSIKVKGTLKYDEYSDDIVIMFKEVEKIEETFSDIDYILDGNPNLPKRVELHTHTNYTTMDGISSVDDYFKNAERMGIKAVAITDKENVQSFPEVVKAAKKYNIKPIYGVEMNVISQENFKIVYDRNPKADGNFVALDLETTGLSNVYDEIIEISAYKVVNGVEEELSELIKLEMPSKLTPKITELTGITNEILEEKGKNLIPTLKKLVDFIGNSYIVAHNASFDVPFLEYKIKQYLGLDIKYSFIDTLNFSRVVLGDKIKRFNLKAVSKKLGVELVEHHRAIYDARAAYGIFVGLLNLIKEKEIDDIKAINDYPYVVIVNYKSVKNERILENFLSETNIKVKDLEKKFGKNGKSFHANMHLIINSKEEYSLLERAIEGTTIKIRKIIKVEEKYSNFSRLNQLISSDNYLKQGFPYQATLLVKNQIGLKNLFKLISISHTKMLNKKPYITLEEIYKHKEGLFLGTAGMNGLFRIAYEKGIEEFKRQVINFDYVEIQPIHTYLGITDTRVSENEILKTLKQIINACKEMNKMVVATSNAYYLTPNLKKYRDIYIDSPLVGGGLHPLKNSIDSGLHYLLTNEQMFNEIMKIDPENAERFVFKNPDIINNLIDDNITVIHDKLYVPADDFLKDRGVDSIMSEFRKIISNSIKAYLYEGKLPEIVRKRLDREIKSIVGNGFAVIYYISYLLVKKSNDDGYIVGSRGSVGSSFVATLMGITEVNPLSPHYRCKKCNFTSFKMNPAEKEEYGIRDIEKHLQVHLDKVSSGFDLPDEICPNCGTPLEKDGHDIPFETFLGFDGDKVPDIDLNFSGEYQSKAHDYCKELFGENHAFRAGTISTVAEKNAFGLTKRYFENRGIIKRNVEIDRIAKGLEGVKRTTGQHPGGIIIIPSNKDVHDFTPVQYPANNSDSPWKTTHFDFHAIHDNVLKLDILGHDDPTVLKYLMDKVAEHPEEFPFNDVKEIPVNDPEVISLLRPDQNGIVRSLGVPEFGTSFVREMLQDTKPTTFAELVKVSGLSHGTDVWLNNAKDLVSGERGAPIPFDEVIGCRDDIMVYLLYQGLEPITAFNIMEFVRKGRASKEPEKWNEFKKIMKEKGVPEWYIWSCEQIKYMFPKAHATAYVLSAMRIAWFKVHRPIYFYAAYFSVRANQFMLDVILKGEETIIETINRIQTDREATAVELASIPVLEVALECWQRNIKIEKPNIHKSKAKEFVVNKQNNSLIASFVSIDGLGENIANQIEIARKEKKFENYKDFKERSKVNRSVLKKMEELGCFDE